MVDLFTEEQRNSLKNAFSLFDMDGEGKITDKSLRCVLRSWAHNPTEVEIKEIIKENDSKGNGTLDFPDFLSWMICITKKNSITELIDAFNKCFSYNNGNSLVSIEDFINSAKYLGEKLLEKNYK